VKLANGRVITDVQDVADDSEAGEWAAHRAHHNAPIDMAIDIAKCFSPNQLRAD
jgi:hypothetical protein